MNSEFKLRHANPLFEEGLAYAQFLDQAAEGFFALMLGNRFAEVIADGFAQSGHDFSFENVIFAERDSELVGMASGFTAEQHHRCSDEVLVKANGFPTLRMWMIQLAFGSLWRFLDTIEDGDFYLQGIAVAPKMRGQGVGSMLMDAIEARAVELKTTRFVLDVAEQNQGAIKLYQRLGMSVVDRWPRRIRIPRFRILRMAKEIAT